MQDVLNSMIMVHTLYSIHIVLICTKNFHAIALFLNNKFSGHATHILLSLILFRVVFCCFYSNQLGTSFFSCHSF
jgi:membrane protein CcdC involved in cytochrome C biogenesis